MFRGGGLIDLARLRSCAGAPLIAALAASCATKPAVPSAVAAAGDGPAVVTPYLAAPDPAVLAPAGDYRIGPADLLEVSVFQVDELNRTVQVDAAGRVLLPLIGEIAAAGKTCGTLSAEISARLGARYLQSPQVTVLVKEARSQRVTLEGALNQPGVYPLVGRTTLLQAIATAKGVDRTADLRRVIVFRRVNGQRMAALFDLQGIQAGRYADPELFGGDVVVLNQSGGKRVFYNLVESSPVLALFRPF